MSCHLKICSVTTDRWNMLLVNEQRRTFSCIGYTIACTVAGPHDSRFLPTLIYERIYIQESPHIIQNLKHAIWDKTVIINQELFTEVFFLNRWRQSVANEADHVQDVICQKLWISNTLFALYLKMVHFILSVFCCVKYYCASKKCPSALHHPVSPCGLSHHRTT